ncbi:MAG: hypothetical protein JSV43_03890 [Methanobacteriota archaeon]|nr:MAG: hypothetical protein JSV43_03890 [Euryarchaeota archaeon]
MNRRVVLIVATVFSFVGVLGLYFYSCSIEAVPIRLGDIGIGDVGTIVRTNGYVVDPYLTSKGDLILSLSDLGSGGTIVIYIPKEVYTSVEDKEAILPGAQVEVIGEVQEYEGELEITVNSPEDIRILQHPKESDLTIEILAQNPETFRGDEVTIFGQIQKIETFYIWVQNEYTPATSFQIRYSGEYGNYTIDCFLIGFDVGGEFHQGQLVRFTGIFEYHEREAKWRIVSDENTLHS